MKEFEELKNELTKLDSTDKDWFLKFNIFTLPRSDKSDYLINKTTRFFSDKLYYQLMGIITVSSVDFLK